MCGIRKEEIVGIDIEHLILEELMRILERRQAHQNLILKEQENQKNIPDFDDGSLAQLPTILTKRPT